MIIRSLLLGSAAAMVAASSAQAADAVIVEPEPVEYVRVCDAYGTGYFFIPGTETCIRINGMVRSAYGKTYTDSAAADFQGAVDLSNPTNAEIDAALLLPRLNSTADTSAWISRGRLQIDARNETEWGTLRSFIRFENDNGNERGAVVADMAYLTLAGFRVGFIGDNYWATNHGYGGVPAEEAILGSAGFYGFNDATAFDYTFAAEGFSVTVGVEDIVDGLTDFNGTPGNSGYANFYAGFNYTADFGHVAFTAVHDSNAQEINAASTNANFLANTNSGEWAWKVSASLDLSEFVPGGSIWGWYMDDGDGNTRYVRGGGQNAEDVWGVAFTADLTDEFQFWANYWSADGGWAVVDAGANTFFQEGDSDQWGVGLNWFPAAAPGFNMKFAYINGETENLVTRGTATTAAAITSTEYDAWSVVLRRDF